MPRINWTEDPDGRVRGRSRLPVAPSRRPVAPVAADEAPPSAPAHEPPAAPAPGDRGDRGDAARRPRRAGPPPRRTLVGAGLALLVLAALVVGLGQDRGGEQERVRAAPAQPAPVALPAGLREEGGVLGRADAPVTMLQFVDPRCTSCAAVDREVLPRLLGQHVRSGRLRLVLRPVAVLGPGSEPAARLAVAAGLQDRMWSFVGRLLAASRTTPGAGEDPRLLRRVARSVPGLDVTRALADATSRRVADRLERIERQARDLGVEGAPSYRIGETGGALREVDPLALVRGEIAGDLDR